MSISGSESDYDLSEVSSGSESENDDEVYKKKSDEKVQQQEVDNMFKNNFKDAIDIEKFNLMNNKLLHVSTQLQHDFINNIDDNELRNESGVVTIVTGEKKVNDTKEKKPLNLAICLDKSGSMSGELMKFAKLAIIDIINRLTPKDILHLIVYDNIVDTIFEGKTIASPKDRQGLIKQVESIVASGGTNIGIGLKRCHLVVKEHAKDGYEKRIFLFSDGQLTSGWNATRCIEHSDALATDESIYTSAFGLGMGFNEKLMSGIADSGLGTYYYIKRSETIGAFMHNALNGLLKLIGRKCRLYFRTVGEARSLSIYGNPIGFSEIGDLKITNKVSKVFRFQFGQQEGKEDKCQDGAKKDLIEYMMTYIDLDDKPVYTKGKVQITYTSNKDLYTKNNAFVLANKLVEDSGLIDKEISKQLDDNNREKAIELAKKQLKVLEEAKEYDEEKSCGIEGLIRNAKKNGSRLHRKGINSKLKKSYHRQFYKKQKNDDDYDELCAEDSSSCSDDEDW